jgi:hypothetical protein
MAKRPLTEKTEKRIAQTTIALLEASGDFDRDALMQFIEAFYRRVANEGMGFTEPGPVTAEWIRSVAEMLVAGFATWLRDEGLH